MPTGKRLDGGKKAFLQVLLRTSPNSDFKQRVAQHLTLLPVMGADGDACSLNGSGDKNLIINQVLHLKPGEQSAPTAD